MGLISRVSSRTYRFISLKWPLTRASRSRECLPKPRSRTDHCHSGFDSRPATRSGTTLKGDTGNEPSSDFKLRKNFTDQCNQQNIYDPSFCFNNVLVNVIFESLVLLKMRSTAFNNIFKMKYEK